MYIIIHSCLVVCLICLFNEVLSFNLKILEFGSKTRLYNEFLSKRRYFDAKCIIRRNLNASLLKEYNSLKDTNHVLKKKQFISSDDVQHLMKIQALDREILDIIFKEVGIKNDNDQITFEHFKLLTNELSSIANDEDDDFFSDELFDNYDIDAGKRVVNINRETVNDEGTTVKPESDYLVVRNTSSKGEGLFTTKNIRKGEFIGNYIGEKLTARQYTKRYPNQEGAYVFLVNPNVQNRDRIYYDASSIQHSNLMRYINHDGNPNCEVIVSKSYDDKNAEGAADYSIAIVALHDIDCDSELSFDYGDSYLADWK